MRISTVRLILPVLGLAALVACSDDGEEETGPDTVTFVASLSGQGEEPAIDTDMTGTATFESDGTTIQYTITVANGTDVTLAHIHEGGAGVNGGVIVPLFNSSDSPVDVADGTLVEGSFTAEDIVDEEISMDSLLVLMGNGGAYVNVHTTAHPAGEIRGQLGRQ
ncbi:MAG TPA: CHRD domain-containing protein [Longimicrobiales bacterium]